MIRCGLIGFEVSVDDSRCIIYKKLYTNYSFLEIIQDNQIIVLTSLCYLNEYGVFLTVFVVLAELPLTRQGSMALVGLGPRLCWSFMATAILRYILSPKATDYTRRFATAAAKVPERGRTVVFLVAVPKPEEMG